MPNQPDNPGALTPAAPVDDVILRLRTLNLSYESIRIILEEYHGWSLTAGQVRYRARCLGVSRKVDDETRVHARLYPRY